MRVDYFKAKPNEEHARSLAFIKNLVPDIATLWRMPSLQEARMNALQLARKQTGRTQILILEDPLQYEVSLDENDCLTIPAGKTAHLCEAIANSAKRLAAIVVRDKHAAPFYYKKVRELSSAEGARMIWEALDGPLNHTDTCAKLTKNSPPDLICFIFNTTIWLGSKTQMMSER
jgi:hypothetical protein